MKFLKLIQTSGDVVCINFWHVVAISEDGGCTKIWEVGEGDIYWRVKETQDEIMRMLEG